jgi:Phage terminase large subunit
MALEVNYTPSSTIKAFMESDAKMRVIMGPVGSGKSVGSSFEIVRRASQQKPDQRGKRRTRFAVVRETARQLQDTTIKTFLDWFPPGPCGNFMRTTKTYFFAVGDVECEIMFRALDDADDVANLNSLELTGAWFNECRDIHPDIIDAMSKRIGRFPSAKDGGPTWFGMWGDTNPPTMDSWWFYQMEGIDPRDGVSINDNGWKVFKQPSGRSVYAENIENLPEGYYDTQGRSEEYVRVYIDGEYGLSSSGQPVYKYFRTDYHIAKQTLRPIVNGVRPIVVGMDLGLTPAAVIGQQDPRGRALVLDELVSFDMGVQRFVRLKLKPLIFERFGGSPILVVTDPAGTQRAQTDERSAVDIIKAEGLKVMPAKTNSISARINAVDDYLMRQVDGDPAFLMDPRCSHLKSAMMGGYRYKPKGDGDIEKNKASHVAEALQYLMLHINASGGSHLQQRREIKRVAAGGWT